MKGASSCLIWGSELFSGDAAAAVTVLDDPNSVLHYGLFNANPQYVILDKGMRVRERFTDLADLTLDRIQPLVAAYLAEADPGTALPEPEPEPEPVPPAPAPLTNAQRQTELTKMDSTKASGAAAVGGVGWLASAVLLAHVLLLGAN